MSTPTAATTPAPPRPRTFLQALLPHLPADWLGLTTHRLDIYEEPRAKTAFLEQFEGLYRAGDPHPEDLLALPTAYDYIRLGHPLACILEWGIAKVNGLTAQRVISFSSESMPLLAVLRRNALEGRKTLVAHVGALPAGFDAEVVRRVYGYTFELLPVSSAAEVPDYEGTTVLLASPSTFGAVDTSAAVDFVICLYPGLGSVLLATADQSEAYLADIQHVRRRETIAMTPADSLTAIESLAHQTAYEAPSTSLAEDTAAVTDLIREYSATEGEVLLGSSGLSVQYAIMMGLVDDALERHPGRPIRFVVPPNCYGGTNDQARRVAASIDGVEVVDLPVDGDNDMVRSLDRVLDELAAADAIPYVIAEIPTNPRVEVPDLPALEAVLNTERRTADGRAATAPVFILDQTFCPNVQFMAPGDTLAEVCAIAYVSGSKFPSGGKVTAGYCLGNGQMTGLMRKVAQHLALCDNGATPHQVAVLAEQMPSMLPRITAAYDNARAFVTHIERVLPETKINFVSEALAADGFTPSVFSLDLPKRGATDAEREAYKRALNRRLINRMITEIPTESKFCVSYGQLQGCYWTVPATTTQGTTKEGDKDYIVRVSVSPEMDVGRHGEVFSGFVAAEGL